jgi:hypothetical protein
VPLIAAVIFHAAVIVVVSMTPFGDAFAVPMGALAAVSRRIIIAVAGGTVIGVARTYTVGIITAAVIVGVIVIEIARTDRQVNLRAVVMVMAVTVAIFDLGYVIPSAFGKIPLKELPGRRGIGHWSKGP